MIYGYVSVCTERLDKEHFIDFQKNTISKRYPSAIIIEEVYENPKERDILNQNLKNMNQGDILVVCSLDRFATTIKEAISLIKTSVKKDIGINIIDIGMIDNTYNGKNILNILEKLITFEKVMVIERTQWGKSIAKKKNGFKEGRPKKFSEEKVSDALELLKNNSYKEVERITGISKSTLLREKSRKSY